MCNDKFYPDHRGYDKFFHDDRVRRPITPTTGRRSDKIFPDSVNNDAPSSSIMFVFCAGRLQACLEDPDAVIPDHREPR